MSTASSGSAGNGVGGERFDIRGNLGSMSEIQQQLVVSFETMRQFASRFVDSERQRSEKAANAVAQAAQRAKDKRRKGRRFKN